MQEKIEDVLALIGGCAIFGVEMVKEGAKPLTDKVSAEVHAALEEIRTDIDAVRSRDPAAKSDIEVLLLYSGVHALLAYRVSHRLYLSKHYFSARLVSQLARFFTGVEIHPGATIGKGLVIDHGAGVVIGETAEIGDNCTLYQGVTLGGTGKDTGKRHPTLGDNVMVGAGAKVLGPFKIGSGTKVASGAVVLEEIPENSTAVGIPARVVRKGGKKPDCMDQVHIPDPVSQELCRLEQKIKQLEAKLAEMKETTPDETDNG
jgi:serine O-acetyltransferase